MLNAGVDKVTSKFQARAGEVAAELAKQFADARVREHLYERRLVVSVVHDAQGRLDTEASTIHGNAEGLHLLGLSAAVPTRWSALQARLGEHGAWAAGPGAGRGQRAQRCLAAGAEPRSAHPTAIYIPLVIKAESADGQVRQLVLIFVPAHAERLVPLLGWSFPRGMPDPVKYLLHLVRKMFRARWDILEPRYQEARYKAPTAGRLPGAGAPGGGRLRPDAAAVGGRWRGRPGPLLRHLPQGPAWRGHGLRRRVDAAAPPGCAIPPPLQADELATLLKDLLDNNSHWLNLASRQFMHAVQDLG